MTLQELKNKYGFTTLKGEEFVFTHLPYLTGGIGECWFTVEAIRTNDQTTLFGEYPLHRLTWYPTTNQSEADNMDLTTGCKWPAPHERVQIQKWIDPNTYCFL